MKKTYINMDDVAAAEYVPRETPSFGVSYPPCVKVFLKQGGILTITEADHGGAVLQE